MARADLSSPRDDKLRGAEPVQPRRYAGGDRCRRGLPGLPGGRVASGAVLDL